MKSMFSLICLFISYSVLSAQTSQEQIESVWKERQSLVKSAIFELRIIAIYPKGCQTKYFPGSIDSKTILPAETVRQEFPSIISLDSEKVRIDEDGYRWRSDKKQFVNGKHITVATRAGNQELLENKTSVSSGNIVTSTDYSQFLMPKYRPLVYTYRGVRTDTCKIAQVAVEDMIVDGPAVKISEYLCTAFKSKKLPGFRYWVSNTQDCLIVKEQMDVGNFSVTTNIRYKSENGYIVPIHWEVRDLFSDGSQGRQITVSVERYQINPDFDAKAFDIVFPPNTNVMKYSGGQDGPVSLTETSINEAGHEVTRVISRSSRSYFWVTVIALAIVCGSILIFYAKRCRTVSQN